MDDNSFLMNKENNIGDSGAKELWKVLVGTTLEEIYLQSLFSINNSNVFHPFILYFQKKMKYLPEEWKVLMMLLKTLVV